MRIESISGERKRGEYQNVFVVTIKTDDGRTWRKTFYDQDVTTGAEWDDARPQVAHDLRQLANHVERSEGK